TSWFNTNDSKCRPQFLTQGNADGLVKILEILTDRLQNTHQQPGASAHLYERTRAISHLLDAMADINVTGLSRENLHTPLYEKLSELSNDKENPMLAYQAKYACQALLHV